MSRTWWRLVELVSRMLEPDERDAVRGDLAESGETGGRALREVMGLVVRRQAALWKDWRPWVALVGLVVPLGMLLGVNSVWIGRTYDLYLWIIRNYGVIDPAILRATGLQVGSGVVFWCAIRCCWAAGPGAPALCSGRCRAARFG